MAKTIIIAEIGECFNGDLAIADKLMSIAKGTGCDIAKFQTLDFENISTLDPEKEWFERISLNPQKIEYLIDCAKRINIRILFTPENIKTCRWLVDLGLEDVKIASSTMADIKLLEFINNNFKRVFMSTGMASLDEVKNAVGALNKIEDLYIMHCISEYPTGPLLDKYGLKALSHEDTRLNMMRILMDLYPQYKIGYSDHTCGILAPIVAVAMGAKVIEKHITLDRKTPINNFEKGGKYLGTDHVLSLEYQELKEMVSQVREVEKILGEYKWERSEGEKILREFLRERFSHGEIKDSV